MKIRLLQFPGILLLSVYLASSAFAQIGLEQPTIEPSSTKLYGPTQISIKSVDTLATILYTLETKDGVSSQLTYSGPFTINERTTVRAIIRRSGYSDSATRTKTYELVSTLDIWGLAESNGFGPTPENYTQAKTYGSGVTVLRSDGTIQDLPSGNTAPPPSGLTNVFAIDTGNEYSLALKDDGSVVAWGSSEYGKTDVPANLPAAVSISAGHYSASILAEDGRIHAWGKLASNWNNEPPRNLANVVAVSEGENYALGILSDGTVSAWRTGEFTTLANIPAGLTNVIAVEAGNNHNLALKSDGTVVAWGGYDQDRIAAVNQWRDIQAISTSYAQSHGLKTDGTLVTYSPDGSERPNPQLDQVVAFDTWHYSGTAIRNSTLDQLSVQLDWDEAKGHVSRSIQKTRFKQNEPLQLLAIPTPGYAFSHWSGDIDSSANPINIRVTETLSIGAVFLPALSTPTTDYDFSKNSFEQANVTLGTTDTFAELRYTTDGSQPTEQSPIYADPIPITQSQLIRARSFAPGYAPSMELVIPVDIVDVIGFGTSGLIELPTDATNIVSMASSYENAIALRSDGTIASWSNYDQGRTEFEEAITDVVAVAAGRALNVILKADGTVFSWETSLERAFPTPEGVERVISIAATQDSVLALMEDGSLAQWSGWLPTILFVPDTGGKAVAIACGDDHSVALLTDGSVIEWNKEGLRDTPSDLPRFKAIAAGREFTLGLTHNGQLVSWGRDALRNLSQAQQAIHIAAKGVQAFAILEDNSVRKLAGSFSQGGDQVAELGGVSALFVGENCNFVLLNPTENRFIPSYRFAQPVPSDPTLQLSFNIPMGRHYQILWSSDLIEWTDRNTDTFLKLSLGDSTTIDIDPEQPTKFYKLIAP